MVAWKQNKKYFTSALLEYILTKSFRVYALKEEQFCFLWQEELVCIPRPSEAAISQLQGILYFEPLSLKKRFYKRFCCSNT